MNTALTATIAGPAGLLPAQSYPQWLLQTLGPIWGFVLPLAGGVVFLGTFFVVFVSRRPRVIAAYFVFLPLPFLLGLMAALTRPLPSLSVIAASAASPTQAQWADGLSTSIVTLLVALHLTLPSYLLLSIGLLVTTIIAARRPTDSPT